MHINTHHLHTHTERERERERERGERERERAYALRTHINLLPMLPCDFYIKFPAIIFLSNKVVKLLCCCEHADPDLNQVGFIGFCQLKIYSAIYSEKSLFILLRATGQKSQSF